MVTLSGAGSVHQPPTDESEFAEFAATVPDPYIHRLLARAEPASPVHGFRDTGNRRRRFERGGAAPAGFVVLGDANCTFNPVYGQGLSVAALGALALRDSLVRGGPLSRTASVAAQRAVSRSADSAWLAAVGADRAFADGANATKPGLAERLGTWYVDRLQARAAIDSAVGAVFRDVFCLTAPPARLMAPRVALRTILLPRRRALPAPPMEVEPV
jgi:2-polyprenyl-6-methoxyphenol hydroxylase-like FAD-dependent oxidoreductase